VNVGSAPIKRHSSQLCYSDTVKTDVIFSRRRRRSLNLWKDVFLMSRIDVFGDRICIVSSLLIVGWFLYSTIF